MAAQAVLAVRPALSPATSKQHRHQPMEPAGPAQNQMSAKCLAGFNVLKIMFLIFNTPP